jgi:hypothetical protein
VATVAFVPVRDRLVSRSPAATPMTTQNLPVLVSTALDPLGGFAVAVGDELLE